MKTPNYKAYYENKTVRIINENDHIAYETTQEKPWPNGVFIAHDMSYWHSTSVIELKENWQKPIPVWFWDIVHKLDGLCKI